MTATDTDRERLLELEDEVRRAWSAYNQRLRLLSGKEYELAESESWEELQHELRRVERERERLAGQSAG
ncbi:MAG TPA: hypothetical protein VKV27_15240 [Solirubrobacteraceae bacterium]|nr:hypothetical protein [Solirubrobacteraceae bacterium]